MANYFSDDEVRGLDPALVSLLDYARGMAGVPFVITSGLRTREQCVALGAPESAHQDKDGRGGKAVDLAVRDSHTRYRILKALFRVGFPRIEDCPRHIHADIDPSLPQHVCWIGQDK